MCVALVLGIGLGMVSGEEYPVGYESRAVHGRCAISRRVSVEAELAKLETEAGYAGARLGATGLVDLSSGTLVPYALVGLAGERAHNGLGGTDDFRAVELGVGLRLAISERVWLGVELRAGRRAHVASSGDAVIDLWAPGLVEGDYRAGRLTLDFGF